MTITYAADVATSSVGCFLKLLVRWRGSIYKLLWKELLVFLGLYYLLSFVYRFALNPDQRVIFEKIALYCDSFNNLIPVAFVLGFYVSIVVSRWWDQFKSIPWPDRTALFVSALVHGHDERPRLIRRTIMRYMCLSFTMTLSSISLAVKKRFPDLDHMREAGLMQEGEQKIIEGIKTSHSKYFIPLVWATSLVSRARKEGLIKDDFAVKTIIDEINNYRSDLGMLFNYDWVNVPMVYTQVVTLAVYTFFLSCLMGRQFLDPNKGYEQRGDMFVPVFTLLQFFFYLGWLKVAETLINPFGEDDDDFEINWVIDRNLQVSYLVVDEMHSEFPELVRDQYWDETDFNLPYTEAAKSFRMEPHLGSAVDITIGSKEAEFIPMNSIPENYTLPMNMGQSEAIPMAYHYVPPSSPQPRARTHKVLNLLRRSSSRGSRNSMKSPSRSMATVGDVNDPTAVGSYMSVATSSNIQTPTPSSPQGEGEDDIFLMSDLDDDEGPTTPPFRSYSSNPFKDAFHRAMPSKSEPLMNNNQRRVLREDTVGSSSSDRTIHGSHEEQVAQSGGIADNQGDTSPQYGQTQPENSTHRPKQIVGIPATIIIKSASDHVMKKSDSAGKDIPPVCESLPTKV